MFCPQCLKFWEMHHCTISYKFGIWFEESKPDFALLNEAWRLFDIRWKHIWMCLPPSAQQLLSLVNGTHRSSLMLKSVRLYSGLRRSSPSLSRVWSRCCATCWNVCWLQKTPHQTVPRNFMSFISSLPPSGPLGEPCSKTRYYISPWARDALTAWLHKEEKQLNITETAEWFL